MLYFLTIYYKVMTNYKFLNTNFNSNRKILFNNKYRNRNRNRNNNNNNNNILKNLLNLFTQFIEQNTIVKLIQEAHPKKILYRQKRS